MKKKILAFLGLLAALPAVSVAQLNYIPTPIAVFFSSDGSGAAGTWNPATGSGGTAIGYVPGPVGFYYSTDGTGNKGTWAPCTASCFGGSGSGTVNSSTATYLAWYATSGTAVSGNANATVDSNGNLTVASISAGTSGAAQFNPTQSLISALPVASSSTCGKNAAQSCTGVYIIVSDGVSPLDCTTGGGTVGQFPHSCYSNGTTWLTGSPYAQVNGTPTTGQLGMWNNGYSIGGVTALPAANEPAHTGDCTNTAGSLALSCAQSQTSLTDSSSVTWTIAGVQSNGALTGAHTTSTRALNLSGVANGDYGTLVYSQDSTGGAYLTGGTGCTWHIANRSGYGYLTTATFFTSAPAASQLDIITWYYYGGNCYANVT